MATAEKSKHFFMRYLVFNPIYQERVWGGRALATELGRQLPDPSTPFGESWEVVDRDEAQSIVTAGPDAGQTLAQIRSERTHWLLGPTWDPKRPFPILVKWLDCRERLSLQVHPPATVATKLGGEPKTENWYVQRAEPGTALIAGLKAGTSRTQFEEALHNNTLESCVNRFPVACGDSLFVPSGRIHAIDGGNLILEVQQNSDTTYRVYDWGRVGLDGNPRQLHIQESMAAINFDDTEPCPIPRSTEPSQPLARSTEFNLDRETLTPGRTLRYPAGDEPRLITVINGSLIDNTDATTIASSTTILLPHGEPFTFSCQSETTLLITSGFGG